MLYNPRVQDAARRAVVASLNDDPSSTFALEGLHLHFPFDLELEGLLMTSHGDTLVQARTASVKVRPAALLEGRVDIAGASLTGARYQLGARDSAMCMTIRGESVRLDRGSVNLRSMDIDVQLASLSHGGVAMWINPADTFPPTPPSPPSPLRINVARVDLEDFDFVMNMIPVADTLRASMPRATVRGVQVDVMAQTVNVGAFTGDSLDVLYLMPDAAQVAMADGSVAADTATSAAPPWTVAVDSIGFVRSTALYTTRGYRPQPGLDFGYIQVSDLDLSLTHFYNRGPVVKLPLRASCTERCGVSPEVRGTLDIDSTGLAFKDFAVTTPTGTNLTFGGHMGTGDLTADPSLPLGLDLKGDVSVADADMMFPPARVYTAGVRPGSRLGAALTLDGTAGSLGIRALDLELPGYLSLRGSGRLNGVFDPAGPTGRIGAGVVLNDVSSWTRDLLAGTGVTIPSLVLDVKATLGHDEYDVSLEGRSMGGSLALEGGWHGRGEVYDAMLDMHDFPVGAFLPAAGVGRVTGRLDAHGNGTDIFAPSTAAHLALELDKVDYMDHPYTALSLDADIADGHAEAKLTARDNGLDLAVNARGNLSGDTYNWDLDADIPQLQLQQLGLAADPVALSTRFNVTAAFNRRLTHIDAALDLDALNLVTEESDMDLTSINLHLLTNDSVTNVNLGNRDLMATFSSPMGLDSILGRVDRLGTTLDSQFKARRISVTAVQQALMPFVFNLDAGNDNALADMLQADDVSFDHLLLEASNDSVMFMDADILGFASGQTRLDSICAQVRQRGDRLDYTVTVDNRPGTFDQWAHVNIDGFFRPGMLGIHALQRNIDNRTGFDIGATLDLNPDSTMVLHLDPTDPVINYTRWDVNKDNFISYDWRHMHLDANLRMKNRLSTVALYTQNAGSTDTHDHGSDEDLVLQLFDVQLQDWIALNPFAPQVKGSLSAGLKVNWNGLDITGDGTVALTDFFYGKERVGDLRTDIGILTNPGGLIKADMDLWVNGRKSVTLSGALNDSTKTSPFDMDVRMIHFPLATANAFMPGVARLGGDLDGHFDLNGDMDNPRFSGVLQFDSATVRVDMLGTTFALGNDSIIMRDNVVTLRDFDITGCNANPLLINGRVDLSDMADAGIDITARADNMQVVNTSRAPAGADVYGKAFVNIDAKVHGDLNLLFVNANLDLLGGTNVTYVMPDAASTIQNRSEQGMVKFVNFNDTAAVQRADSLVNRGTAMVLNANLNILNGSTVNVDLSANSQDRVQIQSTGTLVYASNPLDQQGTMTGRLNINGGYVKYAPPLINNINFGFDQGSYIAFNGDMLNPRLNIAATEHMRANVSAAGQNSRLIYFDILLKVTGTLQTMEVAFDLSTDDDMTVANELASMSPSQRASEAMNLLLYGAYTGGSTKATANLGGNPLYSFLTGQLNNWAANTIKGVDLSFGIDQYQSTAGGNTQTATSYSYQVSKSLFNDRFKIVIGGNYSTDANDQDIAQNLVNDISFDYYLNQARTMYARLFRHTGYESILEGEITQTGVGFVYRRKIKRLSDMFRLRRRHRKTPAKDPATDTPTTTTHKAQ